MRVSNRAPITNRSYESKVTTVYVTHDQIEGMTLVDRVVVMKQGKAQHVGSPTEIYDTLADAFAAPLIGSAAVSQMEDTINGGTFTGKGVEISVLSAADGEVTFGFRAEDADVTPAGQLDQITAPANTIELLADAVMLAARAGGHLPSAGRSDCKIWLQIWSETRVKPVDQN
tara:strand:+ start:281 stop:796 length:516 start_codon:yes stop_codon:yes gene_type:complete